MTNDPTDQGGRFSPAYNITWTSFLNTLEKVIADWPNKVDRSYLGSSSGNVQTYLISAFRSFGLIDDDNRLTPSFKAWDSSSEARPSQIETLLRRYYPTIVDLGTTNATPAELSQAFGEAFPSVTSESRVKAIRFYLAAAEYPRIPTSSLWKAPRANPSSAGRRGRQRRPQTGNGDAGEAETKGGPKGNMAQRYFDLLLKKAEESTDLDTDLLDRIERVAGLTNKI